MFRLVTLRPGNEAAQGCYGRAGSLPAKEYTARAAAEFLGVTVGCLRRAARRKQLDCVKTARGYRFTMEQLEKYRRSLPIRKKPI
jgi:excisionase family DNA binding protein